MTLTTFLWIAGGILFVAFLICLVTTPKKFIVIERTKEVKQRPISIDLNLPVNVSPEWDQTTENSANGGNR